METNNNPENRDRRNDDIQTGNEAANTNESTVDRGTDEREDNKHHQHFGNRKYESHSNHSSNDDQPLTDTSPTGSSPTIS